MSEFELILEKLVELGFTKWDESMLEFGTLQIKVPKGTEKDFLCFSKRILDDQGDEASLKIIIKYDKKFGEESALFRHYDEGLNLQ